MLRTHKSLAPISYPPLMKTHSFVNYDAPELPLSPTAPERRTQRRIMMRQLQYILWKARCLDNTSDLQRTLILDQGTDRVQQLGTELRVPPILPRDQTNDTRNRFPCLFLPLEFSKDASQGLGREAYGQASAVGFHGFGLVV